MELPPITAMTRDLGDSGDSHDLSAIG